MGIKGWFEEKIRHGQASKGIESDKRVANYVSKNPNAVIFFAQEGCGACHSTDTLMKDQMKNRDFKVKKIDVSKVDPKAFANITATPTLFMYKDGKLKKQQVGTPNPSVFSLYPRHGQNHAIRATNQSTSMGVKNQKGIQRVGCIGCSSAHISGTAAMLGESLRFANQGGIGHPEVVRRIVMARQEIVAMERIDLSEDAIQRSPPHDQKLAREFQPRIRALRQQIFDIKSVDQLKRASIDAQKLDEDFTKAQMGVK